MVKFNVALRVAVEARAKENWAAEAAAHQAMGIAVYRALNASQKGGVDFRTALPWCQFALAGRTVMVWPQAGEGHQDRGPRGLTYGALVRAIEKLLPTSESWRARDIAAEVLAATRR